MINWCIAEEGGVCFLDKDLVPIYDLNDLVLEELTSLFDVDVSVEGENLYEARL